jgi:hypothetical protein
MVICLRLFVDRQMFRVERLTSCLAFLITLPKNTISIGQMAEWLWR